MKILYLCDMSYIQNKMSRVRFDSIEAISKKSDLIYSGLGWDNYDSRLSVQQNIDKLYNGSSPDIVVVYKPDQYIDFKNVKVPTCMRYNEMWPVKEWTEEIQNSKLDLIIAHHENDIPKYGHIKDAVFKHIPHSANENIYKDYKEYKKYDILFTGATGTKHYPFRTRLKPLTKNKLSQHFKCKILDHPGHNKNKTNGLLGEDYARLINSSRITLTCSSAYKYRLGKYVEIPMCASILAGDVPDEDKENFKNFMLELNPSDSDEVIIDKIKNVLNDSERQEKMIENGLSWSKNYTQEKYAERFLNVVDDFLKAWNKI